MYMAASAIPKIIITATSPTKFPSITLLTESRSDRRADGIDSYECHLEKFPLPLRPLKDFLTKLCKTLGWPLATPRCARGSYSDWRTTSPLELTRHPAGLFRTLSFGGCRN